MFWAKECGTMLVEMCLCFELVKFDSEKNQRKKVVAQQMAQH